MIRVSMVFWLAAIAVAAIFLYELKHEVQDLEDQLAEVHGDILRDQEAIQVLKAEWSYLNRPARIAELADRYLELKPLEAKQIAGFGDVPQAPAPVAEPRAEEAAAAPTRETDRIGTLIEAVVEEPAPQTTQQPAPQAAPQAAPLRETAAQAPVNPVTGQPLPVSRPQQVSQPAAGAGQPIQLIRTGAQQ